MSTKRDSPFSKLEALREKLPAGHAVETAAPASPPPPKGPARAVVRYERKHRGGKEVTLVEKLGLSSRDLEAWCRELKQACGVGGFVEGDAIVLQGDLRKRLPDLLTSKGIGKITVS